jgi:FkbM family methyltransferase
MASLIASEHDSRAPLKVEDGRGLPNMLLSLYRSLLRLPAFKGKSRLIQLFRTAFFSPQTARLGDGIVLDLDPLEWTQADILRDGGIEPLTTELYRKLLKRGDTYVDVGAHIGFHTLVARSYVGETGRVIAVEPQPYNCHKILTNWRANKFENLVLYIAAVGEGNGHVPLHAQDPTETSRLSLCLEPVNDQPQVFQVPMMRLDRILQGQQIRHVRLLKIDVEGYELETLNGLGECSSMVENIILEVLETSSKLSEKSEMLVETLRRLGYSLKSVDGKPWAQGRPLSENNLWATRDGRRAEL